MTQKMSFRNGFKETRETRALTPQIHCILTLIRKYISSCSAAWKVRICESEKAVTWDGRHGSNRQRQACFTGLAARMTTSKRPLASLSLQPRVALTSQKSKMILARRRQM